MSWPEAFARGRAAPARRCSSSTARTRVTATSAIRPRTTSRSRATCRRSSRWRGCRALYSAGTVDQWPKNLVGALMFGGMWTIPVPDLDRTDYLLMLGANPHASQGSLLAAADVLGRLDAIRARGGSVVVVDPRRTGTAEHAERVAADPPRHRRRAAARDRARAVRRGPRAPRPRSPGCVERRRRGARARARDFTPEARRRDVRRSPPTTIRRLARELADAPTRRGLRPHRHLQPGVRHARVVAGRRAERAHRQPRPRGRRDVLEPDRVVADVAARRPSSRTASRSHRWRSARARRARGARPGAGLVPGRGDRDAGRRARSRRSITIAGNPVLSAPDAAKLDAALPALECMISVDNWLNETTRHAHVILPGLVARSSSRTTTS